MEKLDLRLMKWSSALYLIYAHLAEPPSPKGLRLYSRRLREIADEMEKAVKEVANGKVE